jgi:hypothetical protein
MGLPKIKIKNDVKKTDSGKKTSRGIEISTKKGTLSISREKVKSKDPNNKYKSVSSNVQLNTKKSGIYDYRKNKIKGTNDGEKSKSTQTIAQVFSPPNDKSVNRYKIEKLKYNGPEKKSSATFTKFNNNGQKTSRTLLTKNKKS